MAPMREGQPLGTRSSSVPILPSIRGAAGGGAASSSAKTLRPAQDAATAARRNWTSDQRRLLHQSRERQWLRSKAKHGYIDFSDTERAELRRYFNALAGPSGRVGIDKLENMLISLGLAVDRREVGDIVKRIDSDCSGELDFEQYLEIVRTRTDSNIFQVFKAMMEGKLGDRNLNFQTVISTYRRKLILDATGARGVKGDQQEMGERILSNFAALQRSRHTEAVKAAEDPEPIEATPVSDVSVVSAVSSIGPSGGLGPSFELAGQAAPMGTLEMVWRGVCHEHSLVSSRPASADGRSRRALERPESPTKVVESIVKARPGKKRQFAGVGNTIVVAAPALEESGKRLNASHVQLSF